MPELLEITEVQARAAYDKGCAECLKIGSSWLHLRMCLVCGQVGCCDSSPMTHATKHYEETQHVFVRSLEPGEDWIWNYGTEEVLG